MAEERRRRLLTGGERLRREIPPPRGVNRPSPLFDAVEAAAVLSPQVAQIRRIAEAMPEDLRGPRIIFAAALHPNFLAATHFPTQLLSFADLVPVGSVPALGLRRTERGPASDELTKAVLLAASDAGLQRLESLLDQPDIAERPGLWADVRKFAEMRLRGPDEVVRLPAQVGAGEVLTWEAVLHQPAQLGETEGREEIEAIFEKFLRLVRAIGGSDAVRPAFRREVDGVTFVPLRLAAEQARELARFNPLRALRPMADLRRWGRAAPSLLPFAPVSSGHEPQTAVRVAVFDGGYDPDCPFVGPHTRPYRATSEDPAPEDVDHGHAVTGAVLYGCRAPGEVLPAPIASVDHYRVLPPAADEERDPWNLDLLRVLQEITDVLRTRWYPIVNLSLGPRIPVRDDEAPHVWTAEIDRLARERRILFVTAAGNNGLGDDLRGENRVQPPGDAVNALVVGACAERSARHFRRAPYSAVGPGRWGGRVRPTGVCFGGDLQAEPFYALLPHGRWREEEGTSYAAPLVTHALAGLAGILGEQVADPATLRAFAVHGAERSTVGHRLHELGYGRIPEDLTGLLECTPERSTVLYRDEIRRDRVHELPLPVPPGLPPEQRVTLRLTLCYTGATDVADVVDYTSSGLEIRFRPHSRVFRFSHPKTREPIGVFDTVLDAARIASYPEDAIKRGGRPVARSVKRVRSEQERRAEGKWETTLVGRISGAAGRLFEPVLEVAYYARARGRLLRADRASPLTYALLVSVETPGFPVHDQVEAHFEALTPVEVPLRLQV